MKPQKLTTQYGSVDDFLKIYSDGAKSAAKRLLTDDRMLPYWDDGFCAADFEDATHAFELSQSRGAWDGLTQRAQAEWFRQFDKAIDKLSELVKSAPTPPADWGFPVRDEVLIEAAKRMGVNVPADRNEAWMLMRRFEDAADAMEWTVIDSLRHFQRQQHVAEWAAQPLAKPSDPQAPRAFFLRTLQECRPGLSAAAVATVASVMFQEDVSDRKARQYRPDGLSGKRKNPA